ncbi:hypothetical protein GMOD_00000627 [Pyrenophora seminiperda CCB06]|uniref:Uncharacterized protein n=1 Tax=Pyrenophora seminiperda CCB06 TaxID=1302712 RepID=A0A3M7M7Q3_9PLEO|nr:hypothetical protein GMOD_00000627 [Pyrenophora seminiperda CCB06]
MARTRACKARPRPPGRVIQTGREEVNRGSTVEELGLVNDGDEHRTGGGEVQRGYGDRWARYQIGTMEIEKSGCGSGGGIDVQVKREKDDDEDMDKVDKDDEEEKEEEDEETTSILKTPQKRPRTRARIITQLSPSPSPPRNKKRKTTPPLPRRMTRSATKTKRTVSAIDPESASEFRSASSEEEDSASDASDDCSFPHPTPTAHNAPLAFLPISLLRPYLTFQLSLSNLSGSRYTEAEKCMKAVLDASSSLESSSRVTTRKRDKNRGDKRGRISKEAERGKRAKIEEREDDVLPRKRREMNEQTRRRLLEEEAGGERRRATSSRRSSHSVTSTATYPLHTHPPARTRHHSASSLSSGYTPKRTSSFTDSAECTSASFTHTSSMLSAEESDVIERREKNAIRRRKRAMQKRKTRSTRGEEEQGDDGVKTEPESEGSGVDMMKDEKMVMISRERERIPAMLQTTRPVMVTFNPVVW